MGSYRNSVVGIFDEQNALEFEKTKVKQLDEVLQDGFDGFLGNSVVLAGTERACNALAKKESATKLKSSGDCSFLSVTRPSQSDNHYSRTSQSNVCQLEDPAEKRQVTGGKDKGHNAEKRSGSGTGLFPLDSKHKLVKQSTEIRICMSCAHSRSKGCTAENGSLSVIISKCHCSNHNCKHIQVRGWPVEAVVEGVTLEFFKSRNSSPVREASALMLSITGPTQHQQICQPVLSLTTTHT